MRSLEAASAAPTPPPIAPVFSACPVCGGREARRLGSRKLHDQVYHLARCGGCSQHFCDPLPSSEEIQSFYTGDYHADLRVPGGTEKAFGEKFTRYSDWILQFVTGGRSMDIGTSTGLLPSLLQHAGFEAEGIEFNGESARWGEQHFGVRIRTCTLAETGAAPASFDLITMTDVLEHTDHPLRRLREISEYLRPGGWMLITFPDISSVESRYHRTLARVLHRDWLWLSCHVPFHIWEFTPATAVAMFRSAGFTVRAFRRSHVRETHSGMLGVLTAPLQLLSLPGIDRAAGSQMEFMIQKQP